MTFDIQQYMNNRAMFIGLMCNEDGYEEPFGDVTVNLSVAAPNYCGYLNVNDMPDIEKFITDNDIQRIYRIRAKERFLRISTLSVQCR